MAAADGARTVLVGGAGQVGHELARSLAPLGELYATDRATLDLADPASIRQLLRARRPSLIVNAAAYTAVDRAETEEAAAYAVNAAAPGVMAEEAAQLGALLIHFSTDYVFDGTSRTPYRETDAVSPINVYGRTKLAGERAVLDTQAPAFVFRLSWVYDRERRNFLTTIRRLAAERDVLRIVDDQVGVPTWSGAVAEAVTRIAALLVAHAGDASWLRARRGIYHLAGVDDVLTGAAGVSWADFAEEILQVAPVSGREGVRVARIPSSEYPTPARRPAYSVLDARKAESVFGVRLPPWRAQLRACAAPVAVPPNAP